MRRDNQSEGLIMRICAEPGSSLGSGERSEVLQETTWSNVCFQWLSTVLYVELTGKRIHFKYIEELESC